MSRIVAAFRFLFGLAMVAGGASLAAPTVVAVVRECARQQAAGPMVGQAVTPPAVVQPDANGAAAVPPTAPGWPPTLDTGFAAEPVALDPHYQPPPPPAPIPAASDELRGLAPEVAATYRSTLDAPPPSLLDAHSPPPLASGWTARNPAPPVPAAMPDAVVPQAYAIRDGDDLTGIATRFYGHAAAATAIWSANRDMIPDPNVLPIGTVLRMPPAWTVFAARGDDPRAIEPRAGAALPLHRGGSVPPAPDAAVARPVGWLAAEGHAVPAPPPPPRPAAVRLAPGETLESLARRFYGDERMATRIWEVNRDRLRSPQLVVAGMELRLP